MGTNERDIPMLIKRFGGDKDWYQRETPRHEPDIGEFFISGFPVTVAQFQEFVKAGGYGESRYWKEAELEGVWKKGKGTSMVHSGIDHTILRNPSISPTIRWWV
jgi:formylglycine-generating enzyme required for sulfatase activity